MSITKRVCFSEVLLVPVMEVGITCRFYDNRNKLPIVCNKDINDVFKRKYDIDLERAGLLSPLYLEARLMGEKDEKMSTSSSLLAMMLDMFT